MPEWRQDLVTGRWVIISEQRAERPYEFVERSQRRTATRCPFCAGNESETPPELDVSRSEELAVYDSPWVARVVPNRYPALSEQAPGVEKSSEFERCLPGLGAHEVVIESPRHLRSVTQLTMAEAVAVWELYGRRFDHWAQAQPDWYPFLFKNVGAAAGASLEHLHSQLIVLPRVPSEVELELVGSRRFYEQHAECVYCDMLRRELAQGDRVVAETEHLVAFCPFAARQPYEIWILPRQHSTRFSCLSADQNYELADLVHRILKQLEALFEHLSYNYWIHTGPSDPLVTEHYHWHIEILPRLVKFAGFEWGAGYTVNSVAPEKAAANLREIVV